MAKQEIIPQAVIELGKPQEGGIVLYEGKWKNYNVYWVSYPELETGYWGMPDYILYDGKSARWANDDEMMQILTLNKQSLCFGI